MDPEFPTRLKIVSAEPDAAFVQSRWAIVEWLAEKAHQWLEDLVVSAYQAPWPPRSRDEVVAFAQSCDPAFDRNASMELSVLAACALEIVERSDGPGALRACLAVSTAGLQGVRGILQTRFFVDTAEARLRELASLRGADATKASIAKVPAADWTQVSDLSKANDNPGAFEKTAAHFEVLQKNQAILLKKLAELQRGQSLGQEELDLLWWIAARCTPDGRPLRELHLSVANEGGLRAA